MQSARLHALILLPGLFASALCGEPPRKADLSKLVVVGDSLSAGFQNFSLLNELQVHGFPALIAEKAGVPLVQPLVRAPGAPNALDYTCVGEFPLIRPIPGSLPLIPRENPLKRPTNLAVPGMVVADVLNKRPSLQIETAIDALTNIVLGFPSPFLIPGPPLTQVEQATALAPTTIIVWIGSNDALLAAMTGDFSMITPLGSFTASFAALMDALAATNASLVTANIPNVTQIPYLTPVEKIGERLGVGLEVIGPLLGVAAGDFLRPGALPVARDILRGAIPGPLPGNVSRNHSRLADYRSALRAPGR